MSRQRTLEKIQKAKYVTIGELVRLSATRYSTLKYYTEEGLLPFEQAEENLTRRYQRQPSLARLAQIKQWKARGYSITIIKEKLDLFEKVEDYDESPLSKKVNNTNENESEQETDNSLLLSKTANVV